MTRELQLHTPLVFIGGVSSDLIPLPKRRLLFTGLLINEQINAYYTAEYVAVYVKSETQK